MTRENMITNWSPYCSSAWIPAEGGGGREKRGREEGGGREGGRKDIHFVLEEQGRLTYFHEAFQGHISECRHIQELKQTNKQSHKTCFHTMLIIITEVEPTLQSSHTL